MAEIMAWFTSKIVVLVVCVLALLGAICTPIAVWDHFEIAGVNILWWHIDGLRDEAAATQQAVANLKTCQANEKTLNSGIDAQNAAMQALQVKYGQLQKLAAANQAKADVGDKTAAAAAARISALTAVGDHCKAALEMIHREAAP